MNTGVLGRPGPGDTRFFYPIGQSTEVNVSGRRRFVRHARAKGKDAILLMVFVGPVVATVILVRWLTDGNGAAELLGSVSAALGVVLVTRPAASAWSLAVGVGAAHCLSVKLTHCHTL
jgi:hypothetical protein